MLALFKYNVKKILLFKQVSVFNLLQYAIFNQVDRMYLNSYKIILNFNHQFYIYTKLYKLFIIKSLIINITKLSIPKETKLASFTPGVYRKIEYLRETNMLYTFNKKKQRCRFKRIRFANFFNKYRTGWCEQPKLYTTLAYKKLLKYKLLHKKYANIRYRMFNIRFRKSTIENIVYYENIKLLKRRYTKSVKYTKFHYMLPRTGAFSSNIYNDDETASEDMDFFDAIDEKNYKIELHNMYRDGSLKKRVLQKELLAHAGTKNIKLFYHYTRIFKNLNITWEFGFNLLRRSLSTKLLTYYKKNYKLFSKLLYNCYKTCKQLKYVFNKNYLLNTNESFLIINNQALLPYKRFMRFDDFMENTNLEYILFFFTKTIFSEYQYNNLININSIMFIYRTKNFKSNINLFLKNLYSKDQASFYKKKKHYSSYWYDYTIQQHNIIAHNNKVQNCDSVIVEIFCSLKLSNYYIILEYYKIFTQLMIYSILLNKNI